LRARPEPTALEHLPDASFLGKLLVLPGNVRLDWRGFLGTNTLAYLASSSATKEKSFITLTPDLLAKCSRCRCKCIQTSNSFAEAFSGLSPSSLVQGNLK